MSTSTKYVPPQLRQAVKAVARKVSGPWNSSTAKDDSSTLQQDNCSTSPLWPSSSSSSTSSQSKGSPPSPSSPFWPSSHTASSTPTWRRSADFSSSPGSCSPSSSISSLCLPTTSTISPPTSNEDQSRINWRSKASLLAIEPSQTAAPNSFNVGDIVWVDNKYQIEACEPILRHVDFCHGDAAFGHPAVIVGAADQQGRVLCFQITSFTNYKGGLMEKYPSLPKQRQRWLMIEHPNGAAHDSLPILSMGPGAGMAKVSYVNAEKAFCIHAKNLRPYTGRSSGCSNSPSRRRGTLSLRSIGVVIEHHNTIFGQFVDGLNDWRDRKFRFIPSPYI